MPILEKNIHKNFETKKQLVNFANMKNIDVKQFRQNAAEDGLCEEYSQRWDNCKSKKQLIDLCLGVKGLDYISDAIAKGWGISPIEICDKFHRYINGNYKYDNGIYTTKMYCMYNGEIVCDTTALVIIDSNAVVEVPKNTLVEIYLTGNTNITLTGTGRCAVIIYGDNCKVSVDEETNVRYKLVYKKEKDKHE